MTKQKLFKVRFKIKSAKSPDTSSLTLHYWSIVKPPVVYIVASSIEDATKYATVHFVSLSSTLDLEKNDYPAYIDAIEEVFEEIYA